MKISYNWLKQFINLDWTAEKTGELLTDLGLEVEGIETFESIKGGLKGVVVGEVLTCEKHPNADKLKIATVNIGGESSVQIVCGAPNVAVGQKVPVATINTILYTKEGEAFTIKKGKIRGEESHGMICAEDELGLGDNHDGIMILADDLIPGTPCSEIMGIETDQVFEIGLTPNRADAMSHHGVARDLKAGLRQKEILKELITPSISNFRVDNRALRIDVDVQNNELAPRYCGVTISNLVVQPSPDWLKNRLRAIGLSPINNVVDATNYVLHELGQPLHAFDAAKIKGNKIIVKTLPAGTKFTTLDGVERELHQDDLMICDAEKPMCIAGVFGGLNSGVTEGTTSIFLESAYFDPVSIRRTAKRHALNTDASFRFERGIDINNVEYCLQRAAILIRDIAGGHVTSDIIDLFPHKKDDYQVFLTFEKINNLIGQEIPRDTIKAILTSLEIKIRNVTEAGLGVTIPFYRVDVQREVDLIEEILRVYGYNNISFDSKWNTSVASSSRFEDYKVQNIVGDMLSAQGFYEILGNSLTAAENATPESGLDPEQHVQIMNPLSSDLSVMRQSLLFSGLAAVAHNINRRQADLKLFEFGKTYHSKNGNREEHKHLSLLVTGKREAAGWNNTSKPSDFFFLKQVVYNLCQRLGISQLEEGPLEDAPFVEGLSLCTAKGELVRFGVLNKKIRDGFDVKQEVLYADFAWDLLLELIQANSITFQDIPKYPEVRRDMALLLDKGVSFSKIKGLALQTEKKLLKNVTLFDVYTGENLPEGKKSYAIGLTLQDQNGTLTDKQIDKITGKLQKRFEMELGAELR